MPALPILEIQGESFQINAANFNSVLERVPDLPVVILSINGKLREGKSYVLNHFIRFLKNEGNAGWFQAELQEEDMFIWRSGSRRVTTGINIWSEPFIHNLEGGRQVAVLLLDCQGLYDEHTTQQQNSAIFSLSCLLSSVMMYNVKTKIDDQLLQSIRIFSNYVKAVSSMTPVHEDTKPYFLFLIRDFEFMQEYDFGFHNMDEQPEPARPDWGNYFHRVFTTTPEMTHENRSTRDALRSCYNDIGMFLMPHPGMSFIEDSVSNQPDIRFRNRLQELVEHVMRNLVTRRLGQEEVTGRGLQPYINMWADLCGNGEFPESVSIAEATSKLQNDRAVASALECFIEKFDEILLPQYPGTDDESFAALYEPALAAAVQVYNLRCSVGDEESMRPYLDTLMTQCRRHLDDHCIPFNQNRRNERNRAAVDLGLERFQNVVHRELAEEFAQGGLSDDVLGAIRETALDEAIEVFQLSRSSGIDATVRPYRDELEASCVAHFNEHCATENRRRRNPRVGVVRSLIGLGALAGVAAMGALTGGVAPAAILGTTALGGGTGLAAAVGTIAPNVAAAATTGVALVAAALRRN